MKGLDGREGFNLGKDFMRMPNGAIRSIPPGVPQSGLTIADPPVGGFSGRGGISDAADKIHAAAEMFKDSGFHGQISLAVTGAHRERVRVTGMHTRGRGVVSADMGVSMPGAKESDGDWT